MGLADDLSWDRQEAVIGVGYAPDRAVRGPSPWRPLLLLDAERLGVAVGDVARPATLSRRL